MLTYSTLKTPATHKDMPVTESDLRLHPPKVSSAVMPPENYLGKWPSLQLTFTILWGLSLIVGWRPLVATFKLSLGDYEYTHLLLILPISAALIFLEWGSSRARILPNVRAGSALVAIAVVIGTLVRLSSASFSSDECLSIEMFALVLSWAGIFMLCFGSRVSRAVVFPLSFLFGLVPFPHSVTNEIVHLLQQGSTLTAHWLFSLVGVPVAQNGFMLTIPGLTLEVAKECSSIRSSSMLLVTTIVLAQLILRSTWRKALVIAIALPLSVAKNGLRIFTIAMLGTRVDPAYLGGRLHHDGGIAFFTIALAGVFALIQILKREEKPRPAINGVPCQ